jgi:hypothetical protein
MVAGIAAVAASSARDSSLPADSSAARARTCPRHCAQTHATARKVLPRIFGATVQRRAREPLAAAHDGHGQRAGLIIAHREAPARAGQRMVVRAAWNEPPAAVFTAAQDASARKFPRCAQCPLTERGRGRECDTIRTDRPAPRAAGA